MNAALPLELDENAVRDLLAARAAARAGATGGMDAKLFRRVRRSMAKASRRILRVLENTTEGHVPQRYRKYIDDPVGFFRDELGVDPWDEQARLIEAVAHHDRVACRSGHKCGKSLSCAGLALWWVATRPKGRVVLTAPTFHQVKDIIWRELRLWYPKVQAALDGTDLPLDPATGLSLPGGRQIVGISTKQPENLAGFSGPEQFFIIDEASGFPDELFEVVQGNAAGGAKIAAISNPTRTVGWFFRAFKSGTYDLAPANDNGERNEEDSTRWRLVHISSEHTPNVKLGRRVVPGLATRQYIAEMRRDCGPDWEKSAVYLVRVRGEFPTEATDSVIGLGQLLAAHQRYSPANDTGPERLVIGVDVSRFGGDETILCPRRGRLVFPCEAIQRADGPTVADAIARLALTLRRAGEVVRVNIDGIGVGASVVDALRAHEAAKKGHLEVVDVQVGTAADDDDHVNLRAQLYFLVQRWLRDGGALPEDDLLDAELLAHTYSFDKVGRKQIVAKETIRRILGRSPDRADALALSLYEGRGVAYDGFQTPTADEADDDDDNWGDGASGGGW